MNDRKEKMSQLYDKTRNRIKQLSLNINRLLFLERVFLLFICLIVIYLFWYLVFMLPVQRAHTLVKTRIKVSQRQVQTLEGRAKAIVTEAITEKERNKKRYQDMLGEVKELDGEILKFNKDFITASEMAHILRKTLDKQSKLQLQDLTTLPMKVIIKPVGEEQPLTEQGITFTFRGRYFETLDYLRQLEGLKTHLLWTDLKYSVRKYPEADITITLFLLNPPEEGDN